MTAVVRFKRIQGVPGMGPHGDGLRLPSYATEAAAGIDLPLVHDLMLEPGARALVGTGFAIEISPGFEGQVRPRSGLARMYGITVLNAPGTIDSDYRGEVAVLLMNTSGTAVHLKRGERIAQLVIAPVARAIIEEVTTLSETARGDGGFGSTGT